MSDESDLVDELAAMLGPDASDEQRLAARLILVLREAIEEHQATRRERVEWVKYDEKRRRELQLQHEEVKTALAAVSNRPTLASAIVALRGSSVGGLFLRAFEYVLVSLAILFVTWLSGALSLERPPVPAVPPISVERGER